MMLGGGPKKGNSRATPLHNIKYKNEAANRWEYTNDNVKIQGSRVLLVQMAVHWFNPLLQAHYRQQNLMNGEL